MYINVKNIVEIINRYEKIFLKDILGIIIIVSIINCDNKAERAPVRYMKNVKIVITRIFFALLRLLQSKSTRGVNIKKYAPKKLGCEYTNRIFSFIG